MQHQVQENRHHKHYFTVYNIDLIHAVASNITVSVGNLNAGKK